MLSSAESKFSAYYAVRAILTCILQTAKLFSKLIGAPLPVYLTVYLSEKRQCLSGIRQKSRCLLRVLYSARCFVSDFACENAGFRFSSFIFLSPVLESGCFCMAPPPLWLSDWPWLLLWSSQSGCFKIFANRRGYFSGVGATLSMRTIRCVAPIIS